VDASGATGDAVSMNASQRLQAVRAEMATEGIDLYLVPSADDHDNEYVPDCWCRRPWVSGFTGSAGDALVGADGAWLWTDSRYWLQARQEIDTAHWSLQEAGRSGVPTLEEWLRQNGSGRVLGIDPRVVSIERARRLARAAEEGGGELRPLESNLVDAAWTDRPAPPTGAAHVLDVRFAGKAVADKLDELRAAMKERECDGLVLCTLDAIAWTFNVRGTDITYNPLLISYALVALDHAVLFVDPRKLPDDVRDHLAGAGVRTEPYEAFGAALEAQRGRVWLDPEAASSWVGGRLATADATVVEAKHPVNLAKARKNETERDGMRRCHERDAVALVRFLAWLEDAWQSGDLNELSAADHLDALRAEGEHFRDLSFPTISGFAGNGAIVHYRVTAASAAQIDDSAPYLVDSGAQYLDGTTDVTRTVHLGEPTELQREHYTRVLRGHLALRATRFPAGTTGAQLDALARTPLWEVGLDYGHGTGHGVGCYLNVHEGPQGISSRSTSVALDPAMVVSNEPGLYIADRWGIRIENLLLVVPTDSAGEDGAAFLAFEDLTLVPYARKLIDPELLAPGERAQVDAYHQRVRETLAPQVPEDVRGWLETETAAL